MKHILHIDTSADNGFVAVGTDGKQVAIKYNPDAKNQAASINTDINEILTDAGIGMKDLSAIAVCGGPGSYTGLRIGLATAKSICYALDIPLMLHNKLFLMLLGYYYEHLSKYDVYTAIMPAREQEYFICSYNNKLEEVIAPKHIFEAELNMIINELGQNSLTISNNIENISHIAKNHTIEYQRIASESWIMYAFERYNCHEFVSLANAEPFYLKQVYTHKPKNIN